MTHRLASTATKLLHKLVTLLNHLKLLLGHAHFAEGLALVARYSEAAGGAQGAGVDGGGGVHVSLISLPLPAHVLDLYLEEDVGDIGVEYEADAADDCQGHGHGFEVIVEEVNDQGALKCVG